MDNVRESTLQAIKTVASPLRFFAVAAIVLGAIIVVLAWKSALPPDVTVNIITIAFIVLMLLIILVTILVIFYPKKLVFDQEAHLAMMREQLGDSELPNSYEVGSLPNVTATQSLTHEEEK